MGVKGFCRWLVNRYPKIVVNAVEKMEEDDGSLPNLNGFEFDNLYLDMNGIIYPCFDPENDDDNDLNTPATYEEVFNNIFEYIDRILKIVKPRKLLYLAIGKYGVAPRAKMNQQRTRRFRNSKDHETLVILSDANAPGEGEHKIISFIRLQRSCPGYNPNTSHVLYGLDADIIMLALTTHEIHLSILRQPDLNQRQKRTTKSMNSLDMSTVSKQTPLVKKQYQFLHVWILREYLNHDLRIENLPEKFEYDVERLIDDFIFICFFGGNDFLPNMPTLDIHEGAIDLLIHVYKQEFKNLGGYLVNTEKVRDKKRGYIKLKRVQKFILAVGAYEDQIFKKRSEIRESTLQSMLPNSEDERFNGEDKVFHRIKSTRNPKGLSFGSVVRSPCSRNSPDDDIVDNTRALKKQLKSYMYEISDLFRNGLVTDMVKLGAPGWRKRYYEYKFSAETDADMENMRKKVVQKYTEGLCWVLLYYFSDVPSWTWFFPYHYGPFASDMKGLSSTKAIFEKGFPFKPFDQLMAVLPPTSVDALPPSYRSLMTADDSSILDFYPRDFDVDADGKRFLWLGIGKLPFIEEDRLLAATKKIEKELSVRPSDVQNPYLFDQDSDLHVLYLQKEEAKRNTVNADMLFVHGSENLALQIISTLSDLGSINRKGYMKIDTGLSGDLNGFVHPKLDSENVDNSSGRVKDNDLLCVYYDPPCFSLHIPRVLEGTDIPEPVSHLRSLSGSDALTGFLFISSYLKRFVADVEVVSESDIEEGHLWHETDGYPIRADRSYDATRNRGVGAGSGWSRGRGGFHNVALSSQRASFQDATRMPKQQTNSPSWWDTYGRGSRRNRNGGNHQPIIRQGQTMLKVNLPVRSDSGSDSNQAIRQWGEAQSWNAPLDAIDS
ncbi:hypothetical protein L1887_32805 [Cichorium endivia]|nr:hypothetical protein L1887_32805 [Cichorium endivia]